MRAAILAVLMLAATAAARADVIFSDFGPGDHYWAGDLWTVGLADRGPPPLHNSIAMGFTAPAGGSRLLEADVALGLVSGTDEVRVTVRRDAGGVPGRTVAAWIASGLAPIDAAPPPVRLISLDHPFLAGGASYWLEATWVARDTFAGWGTNAIGAVGPTYGTSNGRVTTADAEMAAFRLIGSAGPGPVAPEPATLMGAAVGAAALVLLRRRQKARG